MAKDIEEIAEALGAETVGPVSDTGGASGAAKQALEAKFREAMESGPATPMTRDDWDELERNVRERHGRAQADQPPRCADEPEA